MSVDLPAPLGPSRPMDAPGERGIQLVENDALAEANFEAVQFDDWLHCSIYTTSRACVFPGVA